jgi:ubiquinone biosynthesis protein
MGLLTYLSVPNPTAIGRRKFVLMYVARTARTVALTFLFAFSFPFRRLRDPSAGPRTLRNYLENCGATFVKLGQILAMRYDLLPAIYCEELGHLLDKLRPSLLPDVIASIEYDLGQRLSELFSEFDPSPLSSASVAQVHAAVLPNGDKVAVKVKHPGITDKFRVDLLNLKIVTTLIGFLGLFRRINVGALLEEFRRLAEEELDFRHEARNIYLLHELMERDDTDHHGPNVYLELCGPSVIVMERLEGVWMNEFLSAVQGGDCLRLEIWSKDNITPQRVSRLLLRSILEQCFTHKIFHADPHAGNLVILEGGTLGYVDFGMVGWLDEKLWAQQFSLNRALASEKIHAAYEAILDMLEPLPDINLQYFEMQAKSLLVEWIFASKVPGRPIAERSSANLFLQLFDLMRRERLNMSVASLRLCRTLMISDIISLRLCPELDRLKELREYFNEQAQRSFERACAEQISSTVVHATLANVMETFNALPDLMGRLRERVSDLGRRYEEGLTGLEGAIKLILRYLQVFIAIAALVIIGSRLIALPLFPNSTWARPAAYLGGFWWWVAAAGILLVGMLGRIARKFTIGGSRLRKS